VTPARQDPLNGYCWQNSPRKPAPRASARSEFFRLHGRFSKSCEPVAINTPNTQLDCATANANRRIAVISCESASVTRTPVRLFLLCWFCLLAACASTPNYFQPSAPSAADRGLVYLYRPEASNPGMQPLRFSYPVIMVDGRSVGILEFDKYFPVELAAGQHSILVTGGVAPAKWENLPDIQQQFTLAPGEVKYLKLDVQFQLDDMTIGDSSAKYSIFLTPMDSDSAIPEIRTTELRSF